MGIGDWADEFLDGVARMGQSATGLWEPTLRLGVTGLSGAGKTVFITAMVASLLQRDRLRLFRAEADGRLIGAMLKPQPDPDVPRFAFEAHAQALTGAQREWPESTRAVSQIRVALRYRPGGFTGALTGPALLNLDIIDYPGEWLLDLPLIEVDYDSWAARALTLAESPARRAEASQWERALGQADPAAPHHEPIAEALAAGYTAYLWNCREAGLSSLAPGRFLMPGDLAGSPALTFAPLPKPDRVPRGSLYAEMADRFEAYKRVVIKPFFRKHFARLDRQVVLVDALDALARGPRALGDLTGIMAETLGAFRHGSSGWLDRLLGNRRIDRLLFAATKADHLHHEQHGSLTALVQGMLREAAARAEFRGAKTRALAIAAVRATVEQEVERHGETLRLVRGPRLGDGKEVAAYPGELPDDVPGTLAVARTAEPGEAPQDWPDGEFARLRFAPPAWGGSGPPHIRLDSALDFLLADKLD